MFLNSDHMKNKVDVTWTKDMVFEARVNDHIILLDADETAGGHDHGPRPKPLTLVSLGGCTGMDVVSILKKMKVELDYFNVQVEGELTEDHPKFYHTITITCIFRGKNLEREKVEKAVNLSREKYCGVSAMLGKAAKLQHKIVIE
jgi:putative redox protein